MDTQSARLVSSVHGDATLNLVVNVHIYGDTTTADIEDSVSAVIAGLVAPEVEAYDRGDE